MMSHQILYLTIGVVLLLMAVAVLRQKIGRHTGGLRVRHFAFPSRWLEILEENLPLYRRLPVDLRERLQDRVLNFVDGKRWKHCGGLESVTDEMKVTIAGQACFLLLGRAPSQDFSKVLNVMVYPSSSIDGPEGEFSLPPVDSWPSSSVLLAWDDVKRTARDLRDERNEVLHEFARQLDLESGDRDGQPVLTDHCQHTAWARVMSRRFFEEEPVRAGDALSVPLAAGDPGEVFAAATELFFEMPDHLNQRHPAIYGLLRDFYKLDPARWLKR
jgi:MtfA peptidase